MRRGWVRDDNLKANADSSSDARCILLGMTVCPLVSGHLREELVGEGEAAADGEGLTGDFQARRGLFAFVFAAVDHAGDVADELERKVVMAGDFFGRAKVFDVGFED